MAVKTQQLRSSTASKRPTASALLDGELALNTAAGTSGAFFEDANGAIIKIGPAEVGGTAPNATPAAGGSSGNTTGELWFDTANAGGNSQDALKVFDGSNFVNIGQVTLGVYQRHTWCCGNLSRPRNVAAFLQRLYCSE